MDKTSIKGDAAISTAGKLHKISKIVIASTNRGKIIEIRNMDFFRDIEVLSAIDVNLGEVEENGDTLEENALLKAKHCYQHTGLPSLADDTGFFVNALGGFPGIHCGRLAGPSGNRDFHMAARTISEKLGDAKDRSALFSSAIAFVADGVELVSKGEMRGTFVYPGIPDGATLDGLGYKNYFIPDGVNITCAQADPEDESFFKHRVTAVRNLVRELTALSI